ncbi:MULTISPECIES: homoserine kinase [unclassified Nocardioides]|uniref:homoserine kinase n=1 Tax=unclassified Nocardioides TaxID=2615069 RepID=UPI0006F933A0|nr:MULTISPECIES: homoserine kinase [unclassified Nocardioides]KQY54493.1 homoserine kinase [Nocardioides sp. Root140]KQZ66368.1 homoserine kinase [Nocardioides sp. Root151]KRF19569.1 homoserine kinase [Nocardioides sp. Soil796]
MARFVDGPVTVSVPATSANLGPGFDSLGLALSLRDELTGTVTGSGLRIDVEGAGADDVPRDESHLVVRAMRAAFGLMNAEPPGLSLSCVNRIPHARGLGSSSAAIVGGLALARGLVAGGQLLLDDDAMFRLAAEIEGHPDNVAPALYGGFVISGREANDFYAAGSVVDPRISAVVFIPSTPVSTEAARGLLPDVVPHADAAANSGRTALLVAALARRPDLLHLATRDYLHQSYRTPAMPQSLALVEALRGQEHPAIVSGAGPTVLAFTDGPVHPVAGWSTGPESLMAQCPEGWTTLHLEVDTHGVVVTS